ncbi:MAG: hypothetical protein RR319_01290 [Bacteroides sp.]
MVNTRYLAMAHFGLETLGTQSPVDVYKGDFLPMAVERISGDIDQVIAKWDDEEKQYCIYKDFNASDGMVLRYLYVYVDGRKKEYKREKKQKE